MPELKPGQDISNIFIEDAPSEIGLRKEVAAEQQKFSGVIPSSAAAMALYNPVTSSVVNAEVIGSSWFHNYDPEFDPEDYITEQFEENSVELLEAKNMAHFKAIQDSVLRTKKYEKTINDAGGYGVVAALGAGILDPIGLYGIGKAGKMANIVEGARKVRKASVAKEVAQESGKMSAVGAGSVALSEVALQATQPSLTAEESMMAIGGGAILGGLIGAAGRRFTKTEYQELSGRVKNDFTKVNMTKERDIEFKDAQVKSYNSTVGAAQAEKYTLDDLTLAGSMGFAKITRFMNPTLRVMQSPFVSARDTFAKLADVPFLMQGARSGKAMPVSAETFAKLYDTNLKNAVVAEIKGYKAYKSKVKESGGQPLKRQEYRKRVSQALRRNDVDVENNNEITEVAMNIREKFLNPLKEEAQKVGLLPEDIEAKFAESYLTRMWNPKSIIQNRPAFQRKLTDWATDKVNSEINRVNNAFDRKIERINKNIAKDEELIQRNLESIKEVQARETTRFDYRNLSSVQDDYLEFLKRDIGLQEVGSYLARHDLEDVAVLVNRAKAKIPKRPQGLISEIVKRGGIKPDDVLKSKDITNKSRVGLFNNQGLGLDVMLRDLVEDGFFPEYRGVSNKPDQFMIDDLRNAIEDDLYRGGVYRDNDISLVNEIDQLEELQQEAEIILSQVGITDYKNFYKNIYEDIKLSKRDLRLETKAERERIKAARKAAREAQKATKPLRDELKRMRNAEVATLKRQNRKAETRIRKTKERLDDIEGQKKTALDGYYNVNDDEITQYVQDMVDEITNNLSQVKPNPDIPGFIAPVSRGPLKEKLLDVRDVDFEEFLENDIRNIMDYYRHHMGTQIELKRQFGNIDLKDQLKEIQEEYNDLMRGKSGEEADKITKQYKEVVRDIESVRDIMLGNYNNLYDPDSMFAQAGIVLRDLQFMAKMGGVTISSLPDVARSIMLNGFSNTADAVNFKRLSSEMKKMTTEELEEAAIGIESVLVTRLQSLAEIGDPLSRGSAITRFTGNSANVFSKVTLINYWNDMQKSISAISAQNRMIKALKSGKDTEFLLENGFNKREQRLIKEQLEKHSYTEGGKTIANAKNWDIDNPEIERIQRKWRSALRRNADIAIVTKGAGDLPLISQTPLGKVLFQFRNFLMASHNRVFLRAMQSRGTEEAYGAVLGATAMVAMGMAVASIKAELYNRSAGLRGTDSNFDTSTWNKRKWLVEGIDRSGLIALMLEPIHIADKAAGLGTSLFTGQGQSNRYASRNVLGSLLGPTAGTIGDASISTRALASPITGAEVSKSDIYAFRRIMPFQNAFIFRQMFDILEKETGEAIGAK